MTESGLEATTVEKFDGGGDEMDARSETNGDDVCPDLQSGRYRFAFNYDDDDAAVGIAFDFEV